MAGAVSNAPAWTDDKVLEFFTTVTRNALAAGRRAGARHHVALSVLGCDRLVADPRDRAFAFEDAVARVLATTNDRRRVVADPDARDYGTVARGSVLLPGAEARIATLRFTDWLSRRGDRAAAA